MANKTTGTTTDKTTLESGDKVFIIDQASGLWRDVDVDDLLNSLRRTRTVTLEVVAVGTEL